MILEGIVTTIGPDQLVHIAPMGPIVDSQMKRIIFRPFRTAQTYQNLKAHPEGVFHVTDDVLLLAEAALGKVEPMPPTLPANRIRGYILSDSCRFYEFRIHSIDDSDQRSRMEAEVVHSGRFRDFFGFNRAKHAVVEAAILATRLDFLSREEIECEFRKLAVIVQKTGGDQEKAAFAFLEGYLAQIGQVRFSAKEPVS
jgi:hypothetical protein